MKKSDFVEVHVYFPTYTYSAGILFSKDELKTKEFKLDGKTLLTKEFYESHSSDGIIDFSWIE